MEKSKNVPKSHILRRSFNIGAAMKNKLERLYRDELEFLRLQGKVFAQRYPQLAGFLGEKSSDPDVERLLEGFAFLSARLRDKIEDDFPELTHSLLDVLWPNYLRPLPAVTLIKFSPKIGAIDGRQIVNKGTPLNANTVDIGGNPVTCSFRTTADVEVYPLEIDSIQEAHGQEKSMIAIGLKTIHDRPVHTAGCDTLGFFLSGEDYTALTLYLWLFQYLDHIDILTGDKTHTLAADDIQPVGLHADEAILPYPKNVFDGYRLLQEFLTLQSRFFHFSLNNLLDAWGDVDTIETRVEFHFSRAMPDGTKIRSQDFSLYCIPAVNLFEHGADPIVLSGKQFDYRLTPLNNGQNIYEIFSVESVESLYTNTDTDSDNNDEPVATRQYLPFESFQHEIEQQHHRHRLYYKVSLKKSIDTDAVKHTIAFVRSDETLWVGDEETVGINLICSNGDVPELLGVDDINQPTELSPPFAEFTNITRPTRSYPPVLDGALHWSLISNLALNYLSMLQIEPLKNILRCYDFIAMHDVQAERRSQKRLQALKSMETRPVDRLIKGLPARGLESVLTIDPEGFLCDGEVYLLGTVLSRFFSLYSSINSFHHLKVRNLRNSEVYEWPLQKGKQPVI